MTEQFSHHIAAVGVWVGLGGFGSLDLTGRPLRGQKVRVNCSHNAGAGIQSDVSSGAVQASQGHNASSLARSINSIQEEFLESNARPSHTRRASSS